MGFPKRNHDPDAYLDYPMDWSDWLPEDDTLATLDVIAADGVEWEAPSITSDGTVCYAWLSLVDPVFNKEYKVTYRIMTAMGRRDDRSFLLKCVER